MNFHCWFSFCMNKTCLFLLRKQRKARERKETQKEIYFENMVCADWPKYFKFSIREEWELNKQTCLINKQTFMINLLVKKYKTSYSLYSGLKHMLYGSLICWIRWYDFLSDYFLVGGGVITSVSFQKSPLRIVIFGKKP